MEACFFQGIKTIISSQFFSELQNVYSEFWEKCQNFVINSELWDVNLEMQEKSKNSEFRLYLAVFTCFPPNCEKYQNYLVKFFILWQKPKL